MYTVSSSKLANAKYNYQDNKTFPCDCDTLWVIKEAEACLGLRHKDTSKMSSAELIEYIEKITLMISKQ